MKVLANYIGLFFTNLARNGYWLSRLMAASTGSGFRFRWPVRLEGKGKLVAGNNVFIDKHTHIGCGQSALLQLGNNVSIAGNVVLMLKDNITFQLGNNSSIDGYSRIYIQNNWVWGDDIKVATYCQLFSRESNFYGKLNIGSRSNIGDGTIIDVADDVMIGNDVAIGPYSIIYTHDHTYTDKTLAAWKGPVHTQKVVIEDGAWIGSRVTILPGVTIGRRAVIAAGAVVTKSIPAETIWGGVPAKQLKAID